MAKRFRYAEFDRAKIDKKARTVPISFSSETPVARSDKELGNFMEVLSHEPAHVDLSRLRSGAPFLLNHNVNLQPGVVEVSEIGTDKKGRAVVRFSESVLGEEIFKDVESGIRRHISVGYEPTGIVSDEKLITGERTIKFSWMPFEISSVGIPADVTVGVGRAFKPGTRAERRMIKRTMMNDECVGFCSWAENELIDLMEEMEAEADPTDDTAIAKIKEAIASLSVAIKGLSYWSQKTAAECVEQCRTTAQVLKDTLVEIQKGDEDESDSEDTAECLEVAIEKLLKNAGGEAAPVTAAAEVQTRKLDNKPLLNSETKIAPTKTEIEPVMNRTLLDPAIAGAAGGGASAPATKTTEQLRVEETTRIREITATTDLLVKDFPGAGDKFRGMASAAIQSDETHKDFQVRCFKALPGLKPAEVVTLATATNGDQNAQRNYSVARGIQSCILRKSNIPDGLEGEVHAEMVKRGIPHEAGGFQVPFDALISRQMNRRQQRDLNATTFGQGGATVATSILLPIIELLRNRMVCDRLGVQGIAGLEGNIAIPRQSGAATAYSLSEQATLTASTQSLDQILLTPHRVGAYEDYSRQLLLQSSMDVENFIREDLLKVIAIKWDYLILQGQGAGDEPCGILNTTGIGSMLFGGTATWAQVVAFETALSLANADLGKMAFATSPGVRGRWKVIAKTGVGVTSVVPIFLWEKGEWADGSNDGEVNGYRAAATNQVLNNLVFFGNWEDVIHALWGGYDVIVDPFTRATSGTNRITVNTFGDVAVRHAASFCVSGDSGAA